MEQGGSRDERPMHPVKTFHVRPALPQRLAALEELAYNLRWCWDHDTINLFSEFSGEADSHLGCTGKPRAR